MDQLLPACFSSDREGQIWKPNGRHLDDTLLSFNLNPKVAAFITKKLNEELAIKFFDIAAEILYKWPRYLSWQSLWEDDEEQDYARGNGHMKLSGFYCLFEFNIKEWDGYQKIENRFYDYLESAEFSRTFLGGYMHLKGFSSQQLRNLSEKANSLAADLEKNSPSYEQAIEAGGERREL